MTTRTKVVVAAIGVAALAFAATPIGQKPQPAASASGSSVAPEAEVWTCSMHPQIRLPKPGNCPICSMPLIRVGGDTKSSATAEPMLQLSEHARAMASVETVPVERRRLSHELRAVGKVQYNETALATVTSRVNGYIERLFVDFTGVEVREGDHLVEIWSPDLSIAQEELFSELRSSTSLRIGAKLKLQRLGRPAEEIVAAANESKSDLIVLSTHGLTGLDRYLMGSVADRVARLAPCPVFLMRPGKPSPVRKRVRSAVLRFRYKSKRRG